MRKQQWLAGAALISAVGCAVSSSIGTSDPKPEPAPGTPASPGVAGESSASTSGDISLAEINAALDVGHTIDKTTFRVAGDPDVADFRVQTRIRMNKVKPFTTKNFAWNVAASAPVRTTPAAFGANFDVQSPNDLLAFAVDTDEGGSGGLTGTANTCGSTGTGNCASGSQYFLAGLYSSQPVIAGWGATTSNLFELGALSFGFNPASIEVYSLAFGKGNVFCFKIGSGWSTSGAAVNEAGACDGWSNTNPISVGNNSITWSEPFPAYDSKGNITSFYYGDDKGKLQCVTNYSLLSDGGVSFIAPKSCTSYGTGKTLGPGTALGPPLVYRVNSTTNYIYVGDASGNFYQIKDVSGTTTVSSKSIGTGAAFAIHGGPAIYYASTVPNSQIYVAAGGKLFVFPLAAGDATLNPGTSWTPTYTLASAFGGTVSPTDGELILDTSNSPYNGQNDIYLANNNALYKVAYPIASASATVYSTPLYNQASAAYTVDSQSVAAASEPLGYPLPWAGSIYVTTATGSTTTATGGLEQYDGCPAGGAGAATAPVLTGKSNASTYGDLIETGLIIDNAAQSLIFGYDTGKSAGGIVSYPLPSSAASYWTCPGGTTSTSAYACGGTATGCKASPTCTSNANCASFPSTPVCDTTSSTANFDKCVQCNVDGDCSGATPHCTGSSATINPNTCVACVTDSNCSSPSAAHCQNTTPDNELYTCVACTSTANCSGSVCETRNATPSEVALEYTCVSCMGPSNWTTSEGKCGANQLCNQDEGIFFDSCVNTTQTSGSACTSNSNCTSVTSLPAGAGNSLANCDTVTSSPSYGFCVQCDAANTSCSGSKVCDVTSSDTTYDSCVGCTPPIDSQTNATCTSSDANKPICDESSISCVQCPTVTSTETQTDADSWCPGANANNGDGETCSANVCTCHVAADCLGLGGVCCTGVGTPVASCPAAHRCPQ